ncbi:MAG: hypothetical protein U1F43_03280 [Myxococcota bacterium]
MRTRTFAFLVALSAACSDDTGGTGNGSAEICTNQQDDDHDGFVDCADQDCWRSTACADAVTSGDAGDATTASDATASDASDATADTSGPDLPDLGDLPDVLASCDPCQDLGQVKGRVCAPSQQVYVNGASVVVSGVGCNGEPFTKETTSGADGSYWLLDVPCGTQTLSITKGSFSAVYSIPVVGGEITDVSGAANKLCLQASKTKIAVLEGSYDNLQGLLAQLGFDYDLYTEHADPTAAGTIVGLLSDPTKLATYDILFANCGAASGWMPQDHPEVMPNVKEFVVRGGSLYMSDYAWTYGEWSFPDAVEWYNDDDPSGMGDTDTSPQQIPSDTEVDATVVDGALANVLRKNKIHIVFDQGPQIAPQSVGAGTFAHVVGTIDVPFSFKLVDAPLALSYVPAQGAGRVIYTNFHNDAQATGDMLTILNYLVFTL